MIKRNPYLTALHGNYVFPEVEEKVKKFSAENPSARLISLGIGDTSQPIVQSAAEAMKQKSGAMATHSGYSGYGKIQGSQELRNAISQRFYKGKIAAEDLFVSDGVKCDIGRLQILFGSQATIALQDPSYPVYTDSAVVVGQAGTHSSETGRYNKIVYLACLPENNFFPDLSLLESTEISLIYFCSPNNPTGTAATYSQLERLVQFALDKKALIIFDAAYNVFIDDAQCPSSIYQINGAREVAIELGSFSKLGGFSGIRLGWSVVPKELLYSDGTSIQKDWIRLLSTFFNGASIIAQQGGIALLSEEGWKDIGKKVKFYKENSALLRETLIECGYSVYGGENAPYLWVAFPGKSSWETFQFLLHNAHLIATPGVGFGPSGEGYVRLSALGSRENILEATKRLAALLCHTP